MNFSRSQIAAGFILILLVAGVLVWRFFPQASEQIIEPNWRDETLTMTVAVSLTDEQRAMLAERIVEQEGKIAANDTGDEPDLVFVYLDLGIYQEMLGELGLARDAYLTAADIRPALSTPWGNLGSLYVKMGSSALAKAAFEKALRIEPTSELTWDKLTGFSEYTLNLSVDEMKELYERALQELPAGSFIERKYASYLERVGDLAGAAAVWQHISEVHPADAAAYSEYVRLERLASEQSSAD